MCRCAPSMPTASCCAMCLRAILSTSSFRARTAARRAHELWLHTCLKRSWARWAHLATAELNFAPSRAWAMYPLSARAGRHGGRYRLHALHTSAMRRTAAGITLEATVFWRDLIPQIPPPRLRIAMAAVVEMRVVGSRIGPFGIRREGPILHHPRRFHPRA